MLPLGGAATPLRRASLEAPRRLSCRRGRTARRGTKWTPERPPIVPPRAPPAACSPACSPDACSDACSAGLIGVHWRARWRCPLLKLSILWARGGMRGGGSGGGEGVRSQHHLHKPLTAPHIHIQHKQSTNKAHKTSGVSASLPLPSPVAHLLPSPPIYSHLVGMGTEDDHRLRCGAPQCCRCPRRLQRDLQKEDEMRRMKTGG